MSALASCNDFPIRTFSFVSDRMNAETACTAAGTFGQTYTSNVSAIVDAGDLTTLQPFGCEPGYLLTSVLKEEGSANVTIKCSPTASLGACNVYTTPQVENILDLIPMACNKHEGLQSAYPETSGDARVRYGYTCCTVGAVPMGFLPSGYVVPSLAWEGLYCPHERDISGRLRFTQRSSFGQDESERSLDGHFYYNEVTSEWCPQAEGLVRYGRFCLAVDTASDPGSDCHPLVFRACNSSEPQQRWRWMYGKYLTIEPEGSSPKVVDFSNPESQQLHACPWDPKGPNASSVLFLDPQGRLSLGGSKLCMEAHVSSFILSGGSYIMRHSGTACEGATDLDEEECAIAARALGLMYAWGSDYGSESRCHFNPNQNVDGAAGAVFYNRDGSNPFPSFVHGICRDEVLAVSAPCNSENPHQQQFSTPLPRCAKANSEFPLGVQGEALEDPGPSSACPPDAAGCSDAQNSSRWQVVAASPFNGAFAGAGVGAPKRMTERKKPTLVQFVAKQYEQKPECQALTYANAEELPTDNPCRWVSGPVPDSPDEAEKLAEEGRASWWATEMDDKGEAAEEEGQAGYTYDNIFGCFKRQTDRDFLYDMLSGSFDTSTAAINNAYEWGKFVSCSWIPNAVAAVLGVGISTDVKAPCDKAMSASQGSIALANQALAFGLQGGKWSQVKKDCGGQKASFSRIFCDLYCIKDSVIEGDKIINDNIQEATSVLNTNMDALMEYYTGLVGDKVDELRELVEGSESEQSMKAMVSSVLQEMHSAVQPQLTTSSRAAISRSLQRFNAEAQDMLAQLPASNISVSQLRNLRRQVGQLRGVLRLRQTNQMTSVATNIAKAVIHMNEVAFSRSKLLGVYVWKSKGAKQQLQDLRALGEAKTAKADILLELEELHEASDADLLLQLDEAWWALRRSIDSYLEEAQEQVKVYAETAALLSGYTSSCGQSFQDLRRGYKRLMTVERRTHSTLRRSWDAAVSTFGLLAAKIQDGKAFRRFAMLDIRGADVLGELKSSSNSTLVARICTGEPPHELLVLLEHKVRNGIAGQTSLQVHAAVEDVMMLADRLHVAGMAEQQSEVVETAIERITSSLQRLHLDFPSIVQAVTMKLSKELREAGQCST